MLLQADVGRWTWLIESNDELLRLTMRARLRPLEKNVPSSFFDNMDIANLHVIAARVMPKFKFMPAIRALVLLQLVHLSLSLLLADVPARLSDLWKYQKNKLINKLMMIIN